MKVYYSSCYLCLFYIYIWQWLYTDSYYPIHPSVHFAGFDWAGKKLIGKGKLKIWELQLVRFRHSPLFWVIVLSLSSRFCKVKSSALLSFLPWLTVSLFQGNIAVREGHRSRGDGVSQVPKVDPTEIFENCGNDLHLDSESWGSVCGDQHARMMCS